MPHSPDTSRAGLIAMMRLFLFIALVIPALAHAQTADVKDVGPVDLSGFDCTTIAESQLLHQVCYDEAHHYLIARIGDDYYDNCKVKPDEVDGLVEAGNVVAFYNQRIRAHHKCSAGQHQKLRAAFSSKAIGSQEP
jgi:hypothetical protein